MKLEMAMTITSPELKIFVEAVRKSIVERPTNLTQLHSVLENLLLFLTTPTGRTNKNCEETDLYFCLHEDHSFDWNHLPQSFQLILDDIGGQLHDTIYDSEIAKNFESTPEQLLERLRDINFNEG
jgi:hypothetical protein